MPVKTSFVFLIISLFLFLFQTSSVTSADRREMPEYYVHFNSDSPIVKPAIVSEFDTNKDNFIKAVNKGKSITNSVVRQQNTISKQADILDSLVTKTVAVRKTVVTDTVVKVVTTHIPLRYIEPESVSRKNKGFLHRMFNRSR